MGSLATFIANQRKLAGLSQVALARAVGVTQQTVSEWERGRTIPEPDRSAALAAALHVDESTVAAHIGAAMGFGSTPLRPDDLDAASRAARAESSDLDDLFALSGQILEGERRARAEGYLRALIDEQTTDTDGGST